MRKRGSFAEKLRIGCSGWGYKDWVGPFYPKDTPQAGFLKFYSRVFDAVEIDSSFYRIPNASMISNWKASVPDNFSFAAKLPKRMTHDKHLVGIDNDMAYFQKMMKLFGNKLGAVVVQLPPSFKYDKDLEGLKDFIQLADNEIRYAIEFRHKSWFKDDVYKLLHDRNVSMAWSLNQYLETPAELTADFLYLRLVGTREIVQFTGIQKDQSEAMQKWVKKVEEKKDSFSDGFVFFNNHFAGFGPASVNEFRRLAGLMEMQWSQAGESSSKQASLADF
ncbi:MAG: DUF72 domain-containing protein [Thaumarchaeota archaeon]|nr:DUF72 domain-containing protein [Nitrososphaerota archaeon]